MASQRILILSVAGLLAETAEQHIRRWSEARISTSTVMWTPDDWPLPTRNEIDAFVANISSAAFTPPILYRAEHVDCWSMGDVFPEVLHKLDSAFLQLCTTKHEVFAAWVTSPKKLGFGKQATPETIWFYNRINEAKEAWRELAERRLIIVVRSLLGGLYTDEELIQSLATLPRWWEARE